jgi:cytochrome c
MKRMMNRPIAESRRIIESPSPSPIQSPSRLELRSATAARRISTPISLMVLLLIASLAGCTTLDRDPSREASAAAEPPVHHYGLGTSPTATELAAWDRDVRPDGVGLPSGSGTVPRGESLYEKQCQHCHGAEGQGGPFDRLAGRIPADAFPFAEDPSAPRTIGSYWPYATTVFDYVRRAMPMERPGSLTNEEVYSLTAYLLFLNELVDRDVLLDATSLAAIRMPARDRFTRDDRVGGGDIR